MSLVDDFRRAANNVDPSRPTAITMIAKGINRVDFDVLMSVRCPKVDIISSLLRLPGSRRGI